MLALEQLVVDEGVTLLYDTRVCAVRREADRITHVIVENKSGRGALACRTAVDATGDADLCHLAGEPTESLDTNVPAGWFYHLTGGAPALCHLSNAYSHQATREGAQGPFFRGDEARDVTAHVLETRDRIRKRLDRMRAAAPEADVHLLLAPTLPCMRMTRRLVARLSLAERHVHTWFDDAVGLTGDWRRPGPVYAVPLAALRAVRTRNLLAAGRCISADTSVWDVTRAIPTCAVTGAAAGLAAALAARHPDPDLAALDVPALQHALRAHGALLHPTLVAETPPADD
jgi:hypothetical protein